MKGGKLGSAVQTENRNSNANLSDIEKYVSSEAQDNINLIRGISNRRGRDQQALTAMAKTSVSETSINLPLSSILAESSAFSSTLSKPQFSHCSQPRPKHPLTLISFPSTGGNNDPDNEVVLPSPTNPRGSTKLLGSISTGKELLWDEKFSSLLQPVPRNALHSSQVRRDERITPEEDIRRAKTLLYKVPKTSYGAKKLAKPYSVLIPPNSAHASYSYTSGEGNSPAATPFSSSSNNIDNKVVNKPKRNKTKVETGFRKRLNTNSSTMPNTPSTKQGLLYLSNVKKDSNTNSRRDRNENGEIEERHGQQSSFNGSSGLRLMSGAGQSNWKVLSGTGNLTKSMSSLSTKLNERVQIIRTAEEKEESPESIRMDGMELKVFPFIGGGEGPNLKLLSLQRNLISRILENTPSHLSHLVVLDLYDNRIERITSLQGLISLRVLLLGKNRIRRIDGFEGLKRLEILDLHGNQLRYVDNLGVLPCLRILNLAGNLLRSIRNLGSLNNLTELNLKRNRIRNLEGLVKAPHLKKLLLSNNDLSFASCILPLRKLSFLQEILLDPNPLSSASDCKHQILTILPWLVTLDRVGVTETMQLEAREWYKRKLIAEEDRRKEESRLRTVSPTGGPSNSREQAIYQARRRWESVKNFVKNTNSKPTNPSSPSLFGANEKGTLDKIGTSGPVRSEIDDDLDSHFRSKSRSESLSRRNSSKESKSKMKQLVLLEYPGGEVKLNLAQLDSDLDQHQPILVSSEVEGKRRNIKRMPEPEDSCPPCMINDLGPPPNPTDYVNTNSNSNGLVSTKQVQKQRKKNIGLHASHSYYQSQVEDREIENATQMSHSQQNKSETQLLLSQEGHDDHSPQMDSAIITNIIKDEKSAQSPPDGCQPKEMLTQILGTAEGDEDTNSLGKNISQFFSKSKASIFVSSTTTIPNNFSREKAMKIAVVRPLLRERNVDETIINLPPSSALIPATLSNAMPMFSPTMLKTEFCDLEFTNLQRTDNSTIQAFDGDAIICDNNTHSHNIKLPVNNNEVAEEDTIHTDLQSHSRLLNHICNPDTEEIGQSQTFTDTQIDSNWISSISTSDLNIDKIIHSTKNEIMTGSLLVQDSVTPRNMLRRSFSNCLPDSNYASETCPTFTFETLDQQSINKKNGSNTQSSTPTYFETTVNDMFPPVPGTILSVDENMSQNFIPDNWINSHEKPNLRKLRNFASFDGRLPSSRGGSDLDEHYDVDDDDTCSITTATGSTTTIATTSDILRNRLGFSRKQLFPRTKSQRLKFMRDRPSRAQSSSCIATRAKSGTLSTLSSSSQNIATIGNISGVNRLGQGGDTRSNKQLRRCESAVVGSGQLTCPLENNGSNLSPTPLKRQGTDYLVEILDGKILSIYGAGALKHTLMGFSGNVTCNITTAKFHYISYDTIIPFFGKLRQIYPSLEHFHFRANNIEKLSQLNSLSDLQGLTSLHIAKEGNPLVSQDGSWLHYALSYAIYRLSHWGLTVNHEVSSDYRGGQMGSSKCFESLGFLALSCLPQTALTPLAKRLHMLHCFCCCSPSSSSDESGKTKSGKPGGNGRTNSPLLPEQSPSSSSSNICTSWDDDPVLLDVIGKEALVYCPGPTHQRTLSPLPSGTNDLETNYLKQSKLRSSDERKRQTTLISIIESGVDVLEKLDRLEKVWPSLMTEMVQEILMDFMFMDNYMKKELKKCQDNATIAIHRNKGHSSS